jgi:SAM-dependent methyltransferase
MRSRLTGLSAAAKALYKAYFSLPHVESHAPMCARHRLEGGATKTLDLGCGKTPKNPFEANTLYGVDVDWGIDETRHVLPCDLGIEPIPFGDGTFEYVTAFDLIEHIPRLIYKGDERRYPFIYLMSEVSRVLKPGGIFLSHTPAAPRGAVDVDPTHVNAITVDTFKSYFCEPLSWASRYGFTGRFGLIEQAWCGDNLVTLMRRH